MIAPNMGAGLNSADIDADAASAATHAGLINTTGTCTGKGGCTAGDACVYDYDTFGSDACCAHTLP